MTEATQRIFWGGKKGTEIVEGLRLLSGTDATTVATSDKSWQYSRLLPLFSFLPCSSTPFMSKAQPRKPHG